MTIWAVLAVALISIAGDQFGYALSLAGVAGLVISLGVTADSYIVFFERLKDEVRSGKSPRAAVQPAFARAYKTIVAADFVTIIAAGVLYLTAVSSVAASRSRWEWRRCSICSSCGSSSARPCS